MAGSGPYLNINQMDIKEARRCVLSEKAESQMEGRGFLERGGLRLGAYEIGAVRLTMGKPGERERQKAKSPVAMTGLFYLILW